MFAEQRGVTEEELIRIVKKALCGNPDVELTDADVIYMAIQAYGSMGMILRRISDFFLSSDSHLMTVNETVEFTRLSRATIYRLMKKGLLRSRKIHGRRFIFKVSAEEQISLCNEYRTLLWDGYRPRTRLPEPPNPTRPLGMETNPETQLAMALTNTAGPKPTS